MPDADTAMRKGQTINMNKKLFEKYGKEMAVMVFKHHYDDNFLKWHFTSVGMHEERQNRPKGK